MSTAVLHGAGLGDWCMETQAQYLNLLFNNNKTLVGLELIEIIGEIRFVQGLGDALSLMNCLESSFKLIKLIKVNFL